MSLFKHYIHYIHILQWYMTLHRYILFTISANKLSVLLYHAGHSLTTTVKPFTTNVTLHHKDILYIRLSAMAKDLNLLTITKNFVRFTSVGHRKRRHHTQFNASH